MKALFFLVTFWQIESVQTGCGYAGCLAIHFKQEMVKHKKVFIEEDEAKKFCEGKDPCDIEPWDIQKLNNHFDWKQLQFSFE